MLCPFIMSPEWWSEDLAEDVHDTLRAKEQRLPIYFAQSPQLHTRRYLVDWLAIIAEKHGLCEDAKHLSVFLLDYFMDKFDIQEQQLKLVALGCLLVAAKFESQDSEVPKSSSLNKYVGGQGYSLREFLQMELTLLDFFKWNIGLPTPSHFINYYLRVGVTEEDFHVSKVITDLPAASHYMEKYVAYFIEISTQDHCYREFVPSLLAASCIAASRVCLQISPLWSEKLELVTGYSFQQVEPVIKIMLRTHQIDEFYAEKRKESFCTKTKTEDEPIGKEDLMKTNDFDLDPVNKCPQVVESHTLLKPSSCYTAHSMYYMTTAVRLP